MKKIISYIHHHYQEIYKISLFIIAIVAIVYFFPNEAKFRYEFQKGKPWRHKDLIAPTAFPIQKSDETIEREKNEILKDLRPYFEFKDNIYPSNKADLLREFRDNWRDKYGSLKNDTVSYTVNRDRLVWLYDSIGSRGLMDAGEEVKKRFEGNSLILIKNKFAQEMVYSRFFTPETAMDFIKSNLDQKRYDSSMIAATIRPYLNRNVIFDPAKTVQERENLISSISTTYRMVQKGELIVAQGEPVDQKTYQVLLSLKKEYEESLATGHSYNSIVLGQIILVTVTILMLVLFLYFLWPAVFDNNRKIILILLLLILMVFLTGWISRNFSSNYIYLLPICIVPIVIRAFFDSRLALFVHLITIILISFIVPNSFEFVFLQLIAGIITILTVMDLQKRSQFFIPSLFIFFSYSVTYVGITLLNAADPEALEPMQFAMFAGSAIITLFSYPLLYIFEKLLGLTTDVSLMEYSDSNSKLLRQLAETAPGTFQHSIQVANLSEEVIHKIGGNALLVRTGALYHDIGKMENPMFFIENQNGNFNPHDELSNTESARILIEHVTAGIEMAKKHKLPEQIIDFIRTHHGTKKVEYFYAMEKRDNPDEVVDQKNFQYHGPAPFSRETAVVMMADSVEAASRSLKKPSEKNINKLVDNIIDKQMAEEQFYNSDITFADISAAKKILKRKLHNIYHVRIEYPE